jgi:putative Holliday junction resolvase
MSRSILSLDYGTKRMGLAYYNDEDQIPRPLKTIVNNGHQKLANVTIEILKEKKINILVVGIPLNKNLEITPMTEKIRKFIKLIQEKASESNIPEFKVSEVNEEYSSDEAISEYLESTPISKTKLKEIKDELAALIILKRYLNIY